MMNEDKEAMGHFLKDGSRQKRQPLKAAPVQKKLGRKGDYLGKSIKDGTLKKTSLTIETETHLAIRIALGSSHLGYSQNTLINKAIQEYLGSKVVNAAKTRGEGFKNLSIQIIA